MEYTSTFELNDNQEIEYTIEVTFCADENPCGYDYGSDRIFYDRTMVIDSTEILSVKKYTHTHEETIEEELDVKNLPQEIEDKIDTDISDKEDKIVEEYKEGFCY